MLWQQLQHGVKLNGRWSVILSVIVLYMREPSGEAVLCCHSQSGWMIDTDKWTVHCSGDVMEKETELWLSETFMTICSHLNRTLLRGPNHRSPPSIRPSVLKSSHQPGDPSVLPLSISRCSFPSVCSHRSWSTAASLPRVNQGLSDGQTDSYTAQYISHSIATNPLVSATEKSL